MNNVLTLYVKSYSPMLDCECYLDAVNKLDGSHWIIVFENPPVTDKSKRVRYIDCSRSSIR